MEGGREKRDDRQAQRNFCCVVCAMGTHFRSRDRQFLPRSLTVRIRLVLWVDAFGVVGKLAALTGKEQRNSWLLSWYHKDSGVSKGGRGNIPRPAVVGRRQLTVTEPVAQRRPGNTNSDLQFDITGLCVATCWRCLRCWCHEPAGS